MNFKKVFSTFVISTILFQSSLVSETFRVRKAHILKLGNNANQTGAELIAENCNIYDAVAVYLPDDKEFMEFLEGVELKIGIPEAVASWRNSVAATIYDRITPEPTARQIDYTGTRLFVNALPGKLSWVIQVPLKKENNIKENQFSTKIDSIPSDKCTNIFLKFQPVMKGIPEEVINSELSISARPILSDKGRLKLNVNFPKTSEAQNSSDNETPSSYAVSPYTVYPYTVYIDDIPYTSARNIILKTGIHNLSIVSENFRNEVRTFYIQQAKSTELDITLRSVEPSLVISSPEGEGIKVFLDGEEYTSNLKTQNEFVISEGEHTVKFQIGSYEVVRNITAVKGKTYKATLDVELNISDDE